MDYKFWMKVAIHKNYFDAGLGLTSYFKYFIGGYALSSLNIEKTLWLTLFYGVACYFLGIILFKTGWIEANTEVSNRFNPFVKEMRKKINGKKFK